jgi:hypothetical protein
MFQYLDKSAMSNTAILGLRTDLHMSGGQYSWASSLFNFGYLAASGPFALLMVRYPTGKFMAVYVYVVILLFSISLFKARSTCILHVWIDMLT